MKSCCEDDARERDACRFGVEISDDRPVLCVVIEACID